MQTPLIKASRRNRRASTILALTWIAAAAVQAQTPSDMVHTKHNLSVSGPGPIRAVSETRICIFCHTPHNASPQSPLWNKDLEPRTYSVYESATLRSGPLPQPSGPTKLCLSCHDGTIAMGAVVNPASGIAMAGGDTLAPGSLSNFGLNLSGHHPVAFPYHAALPNTELLSSPPPNLTYGGGDEVHCTTCHDPHNDTNGKFLVKDNRYSALCTECHQMTGWASSAHATSTASVVGILPRPPKTWPTYTQLNEWGCEVCHTPHFAPTPEQLLNFTDVPPTFSCTTEGCHNAGAPPFHVAAVGTSVPLAASRLGVTGRPATGTVNIARQTRKVSAHHESFGALEMMPRSGRTIARSVLRSVGCPDCHNPHLTTYSTASAPYVSGMLRSVTGVDRYGADVRAASFEYEICFKCHSDNTPDIDYVPRVISVTNTRLAFDPSNPSYHPVISTGKNLNVPSIPSTFEPTMNPSVMIYCTTCHSDDEGGSRGPHGSSFRPILRERYETADFTPESFDNYALCYRCHERASILRDVSFQKRLRRTTGSGGGHSGHLAASIACAACHDAHGVNEMMGGSTATNGSHTHLINFDTRTVLPKPGSGNPTFKDAGTFSGSCSLCCHNVLHDDGACGGSAGLKAQIGGNGAAGGHAVGAAPAAPAAAPASATCSYSRVVCGAYP